MGRADLHIHPSDDPDAADSASAFYAALLASDLDVAVLADHDRIAVAQELVQRAREEHASIELVVGEEITSRRGHVLGIGLTAVVPPFLSLAETIAAVHEQGAIAVVAHPLMPIWTSASEEAVVTLAQGDPRSLPDGLEAMHPTAAWFPRWRRRVERLAARTGIAVVGGSDAHSIRSIGRGWTEFEGTTAADLYTAIRAGRTHAGGSRTPIRNLLWVERSSRAATSRYP